MRETIIKRLSIISGICIFLPAAFFMVWDTISLIKESYFYGGMILTVIEFLIAFLILIACIKRSRILLVIAWSLDIIYHVFLIYVYNDSELMIVSMTLGVIKGIAYIAVLSFPKKKKAIINSIWFIPPLLALASIILQYKESWDWFLNSTYSVELIYFIASNKWSIATDLLKLTGQVILVICIKELYYFKEKAETMHQNNDETSYKESSDSSEADRIKQLKELLDDGILTEEEYNEKKSSVLNSNQVEYQPASIINNEERTMKKKKPIYKHPAFIIPLVISFVVGSIILFDACTISYSEAKIAADEAAAEYREAANKVSELEYELEDVNEKIDKIEYNDDYSLSYNDYYELQDLEKKQDLLERDLATYQKLSEYYQKDAAEKASIAMELGGSLKFKLKK